MSESADLPPLPDEPTNSAFENGNSPTRARGTGGKRLLAIGCASLVAVAAIAALVATLTVSAARKAKHTAVLQERAYQISEDGDWEAALPVFTALLEEKLSKRERAYALDERGRIYANLRRDPEAIRDFDDALRLEPNLASAIYWRGLAYHRAGKYEAARADYNRAIELDPNNVRAYENRAFILGKEGCLDEAIADMTEAIRCDPSQPRWFIDRGNLFYAAGDPMAALASFESAIRLDPESVDGFWGRATILAFLGMPERRIAEVDAAIALRPHSARLYHARGLIHMDAEEPEKARADFEKVVQINPEYAIAYSNLAANELRQGKADAAIAYAGEALRLNAKLRHAHFVRGRAYSERGDFAEAIAEFDRAIVLAHDYVWAIGLRALNTAYLGDYERARRDLDTMVLKFPGVAEAHLVRAKFLASCPQAESRDGAEALREARLAVAISRESSASLDVLAAAHAELGDFEQATEIQRVAVAKLPDRSHERAQMAARLHGYQKGQPFRDER